MPLPRIVTCPTCGKHVDWTPGEKWRPFCSERCKVIDLGAWANESYRIPAVEREDDESMLGDPEAPASSP